MKRVLFVDDDPLALQAVASVMRSKRHEWEMVYVSNPAVALETLSRRTFDAVVSDFRMNEMDGVQLLGQVAEKFPETRRLLLTAESNADEVRARAASVAHVVLEKPCTGEQLREALSKTLG